MGIQHRIVIHRHQGLPREFYSLDLRFCKKMKRAVERLQLHREVVFVARDAIVFLAVACRDISKSFLWSRVAAGLGNRTTNLRSRTRQGILRQVRPEKAPSPVDHVAFRAPRLAEENGLASLWVTGNSEGSPFALKGLQ